MQNLNPDYLKTLEEISRYPILIGSEALNRHGLLKNRKADDIDFLCYIIPSLEDQRALRHSFALNRRIEYHIAKPEEPTTKLLLDAFYMEQLKNGKSVLGAEISTWGGYKFFLAPLKLLKVLKISSLPLDKAKHQLDLEQMKDVKLTPYMEQIARQRTEETQARIEMQKAEFFNKYPIVRYIPHDEIHTAIANTWTVDAKPIYTQILTDQTTPSEELFANLCFEDKRLIIWEEAFALALERFFIFNWKHNQMPINLLSKMFCKFDTSADIPLKWLYRLSIKGRLKDHPDWLADWALMNHEAVLDGFEEWWIETFKELPVEFWAKINDQKEPL